MLGTVLWSIGRAEVPQHRAKKAIVINSLVINQMCRSLLRFERNVSMAAMFDQEIDGQLYCDVMCTLSMAEKS